MIIDFYTQPIEENYGYSKVINQDSEDICNKLLY